MRHRYLFLIVVIALFASCEKKEGPIVLPPRGAASNDIVDMGRNYERQVFYDFATKTAVTSDPTSWDLAFEAGRDGRHVFMNGLNVFVYNTHETEFSKVSYLPAPLSISADTFWQYDNPNGLPTGTAVGNWWKSDGSTKGEVYIVRLEVNGRYELNKMRLLTCNDQGYTLEWMPLNGTTAATQVQLTKDSTYNYIYYSFKQGVTKPDPPKTTWDIQFTRCRELVYHPQLGRPVPYLVTSVLLNPYRTTAAADSITAFSDISLNTLSGLTFTTNRNVIGYDWKSFDISNPTISTYQVNRKKNYIVKTQNAHIYKLHFLDFYNSGGQKGSPSFEFERLQ